MYAYLFIRIIHLYGYLYFFAIYLQGPNRARLIPVANVEKPCPEVMIWSVMKLHVMAPNPVHLARVENVGKQYPEVGILHNTKRHAMVSNSLYIICVFKHAVCNLLFKCIYIYHNNYIVEDM